MKKQTMFLLILSVTLNFTLAQNWLWSGQLGGNSYDLYSQICNDNSGNLYFSGSYQSDPCFFGNDTLHILGASKGFFLVKLDANGERQWIVGYDGSSQNDLVANIFDMTYDDINNYIYITGFIKGSGHIGNISLVSNGSQDIFIAKFDVSGNCIWAKKAGGLCESIAESITTDGYGNVIITGKNDCSASFDTITVQPGYFLAKYSPNGNCIWAKKLFNLNLSTYGSEASLWSLSAKGTDIFALGGSTVNSFTTDTITVTCNYPTGQYLIARFDSNGVVKWIKPCAGEFHGAGYDIKVDDSLNSYITGSFGQSGIFGYDTLSTTGIQDLFLAKFSSTGFPVWVKQTNPTIGAAGSGLALKGNDIYVTGGFADTATFGTYTVISYSTNGDMFAARYNTNGNCLGIIHVGPMGSNSISVDGSNNIYVTGSFHNTVTFGSNTPLTPYGQHDIYIAKSSVITGITELKRFENNQLIIYANPNSGICNVTIPDEFQNEKNLTLYIYDNSGKLIQQTTIEMSGGKIKLDIAEEAKGMYNVILSNGKKTYNGKLVFE